MINMRIKDMFFDRHVVIAAVDNAKRKVLSKAGAFIRTAAKTSIRKRKGSAPPGAPPHSHEGSLRRLILFGYDKPNDSVVVGPVGFKKSDAPSVLEYGGDTVVLRRVGGGGKLTSQKVKIAPRPYMAPALEKERPKLPLLWRNSVRKG
ncbi:MAG: hypothetical protein HRU76_01490 [Phycisphaeraceae bacterium]|nr:MAG: hypothetical protein HRU76_01490 [Phycisphaeraceae bacterium]